VDLVVVDLTPPAKPTLPEHTAEMKFRVTTRKASPTTKTFRWVVSIRMLDGSYAELMTSPPEAIPAAGVHRLGQFTIPVAKGLTGRVHLRLEARPEGPGDLVPADNVVEADLVVAETDETAPAPAAFTSRLPVALAALLPSGALTRETATSVTFLLSHVADAAGATILEASLESGGTTLSLGEFDVPAGVAGTTAAIRARLRTPSSVPVGAATLLLVVRDESGSVRAAVRQAVTVR
jgi:hypothetical protein